MTLTRISIVTGLVVAAVNLAVLFGLELSTDQLAGIATFATILGGSLHAWVNPDVKWIGYS